MVWYQPKCHGAISRDPHHRQKPAGGVGGKGSAAGGAGEGAGCAPPLGDRTRPPALRSALRVANRRRLADLVLLEHGLIEREAEAGFLRNDEAALLESRGL